jgi:hypothetical protein
VDGVILFATGENDDKRRGEDKIRAAAKANGAARMKPFAVTLASVASLPGGDSLAASVGPITSLMTSPTEGSSPSYAEPTAPRRASTSTAAGTRWRSGTAVPSLSERRRTCSPLGDFDANCVLIAVGAAIVTDLHFARGCPDEMFVLAGDLTRPHWFVLSPVTASTTITGAHLYVAPDEEVFVGSRTTGHSPSNECFVTWAAQLESASGE